MLKKDFISVLRFFGYKARYSNISWFYNSKHGVIGGLLYLPCCEYVFFCRKGDGVKINCSYLDDIEPLIYG